MPVPQTINLPVGWAGEPALERLINNCARCHIKSGSIVGRKTQSTVNNHGLCNRNRSNSSALICVNLPVSAVKKKEVFHRR
ncbi:hypothetical protein QUA54_02305 [Microcoleus sp. MOSTC5]